MGNVYSWIDAGVPPSLAYYKVIQGGMMDSYKQHLQAFYNEFYGGKEALSRKEIRSKLGRLPFGLNRFESNSVMKEGLKHGILEMRGKRHVLFKLR